MTVVNALLQWCCQVLAGLNGSGLCTVLCVALLVGGVMGVALAMQIAATKPTIEWSTKNGPIRVQFPHRTGRKPSTSDRK